MLYEVITVGLGAIKIKNISIGVGGVLFSGIAIGHFLSKYNATPNAEVLHFIKAFGMMLFVYTIGNRVGPNFFSSLKEQELISTSGTSIGQIKEYDSYNFV